MGQHYTQRWAKEDLENERLRGAADANASIDGNFCFFFDFSKIILKIYIIVSYILYFVGKGSEEAIQMLKKAEAANEESPFGELTQRLVAGLLEENAINQADVEESTKKGKNKQTKNNKNNKQSSKTEKLAILVDAHDFRGFCIVSNY